MTGFNHVICKTSFSFNQNEKKGWSIISKQLSSDKFPQLEYCSRYSQIWRVFLCLQVFLFWKTFLTHSTFLRAAYLFHHSNCSHPSLFDTERIAVIYSLKCTVFILIVEVGVIHCLSNFFNSSMFFSKKILF